ncbi:inositol-trisphosphate 3-kinase B isoform X2 [Tetranychus urticae]|uniref:inositol-trisphosphate 3-kinase B isoform X2 n=1 Tax=Tetranychus urticae TaxID=32264 RepID=UPI00077B8AE7|nr:inositol-trisphosphate 3-kinase B isoform X2 [Tetranychus urticae]
MRQFTNQMDNLLSTDKELKNSFNHWRIVRNALRWSPFVQTYKKRKYPWVQLAGHQGNFKSGTVGTILKKSCGEEEKCFQKLINDPLSEFVPKFRGKSITNGEEFLELEDLLAKFDCPSVMDMKIGLRTYLEDELIKAREKPKLRKDMFEKMIAVDPAEPNEEERRLKAVTKPRYMVWRETISSTATLGFRIDGIKFCDGTTSRDFKTTKSDTDIIKAIQKFTENRHSIIVKYLERLKNLRQTLVNSPFFLTHEIIGSSLLFVHDLNKADVWMIDFAKTHPIPKNLTITHSKDWMIGNHEDGYLIGVDNIIRIFTVLDGLSKL